GGHGACEVFELKGNPSAKEFRVTARDRHVVEKNVGIGMTANRGHVSVEQEASTRVRSAANNEQRRSRRQRANCLGLLGRNTALHRGELRAEFLTIDES